MSNYKHRNDVIRGRLAQRQAEQVQAAAPAGVYLAIVILCNREGSSIAAHGRKVTTTELIQLLESQVRELRASIPDPPPLIVS